MNGASHNLVEVRDLTVGYGEHLVLEGINFEVRRGEVFAILGVSGSGKSTLLKHLIGLYQPMRGDVLISGASIVHAEGDERLRILRRFGVLYQGGALFGSLTTVENVAVPLILKRRKWDEAIKEELQALEKVGLAQRAGLSPQKLSGGEQQRVAIARAIVSQPDILVLDEPTASLDGDTGRKIVEFVKRDVLNEKRCIIIVTHDDRISEFADRMVKMEDGKLIEIEKGQGHA